LGIIDFKPRAGVLYPLGALRSLVAILLFTTGGLLAAEPGDPPRTNNRPTSDKGDRLSRSPIPVPAREARPLPVPSRPTLVPIIQVQQWLADWQSRLKLDDWKIEARFVRSADLRPNTLGNVKWDRDKKTATIRILDPADYDLPAARIPSDVENTIVHELVHIRLCSLPADRKDPKVEEAVVNPIVDALLETERRGQKVAGGTQ
jgi:hypothetical protein